MFTNCLIVEDQTMFAEALAISLVATGLVGKHTIATNLEGAAGMVRRETFDLVVSDLLFPEGNSSEFIGSLTRLKAPPKILVVTSLHDPWHLQSVLKYPVDAIVTKGELFQALRERLEGLMPLGPQKSRPVNQELVRIGKLLSKREQEVLLSVGGGGTNQDIAVELGLSVRTVETHRKNISNKLKIRAGELFRAAVHFRDASISPGTK
jgi:DNA-binding NarL/FixJ family response regulator